ncbi:cell division protein FtsH [Blautia argi]|uniref:ATP-dependent zinc metalloprotease FtsH n=2 Tax=Blautia argi TaxID=1912897 RepID=A0A2Z4UEY9_9FIRM|nr:cell division protein FtsH [Blautia argi]
MLVSRFTERNDYTMEALDQAMEDSQVTEVFIRPNKEVPTGKVLVRLKTGEEREFTALDVKEVQEKIEESGEDISVKVGDVPRDSVFLTSVMPLLLTGLLVFFMFGMMNRQMSGGGSNAKMMNFGKSRAKMSTDADKKVTFKEVAGLQEEKEELEEIVDFLKEPQKYVKVGARIPKGVLLVGPPGTGKTLLAKAVAGEAGVPFFSISGSDFVEMFVGVGASRVRDLFEEAKKNAPCIIFIDEIDAVARRRGTGMGGGHDEREQTLNQLLVEMDGFGVNEGIIVMSATNRVDILDPAILRPGRFDRKVGVGRPDIKGREEILKVHAAKKPLGEDVDLEEVARTTAGYTGADLENLMNEAAILTAKDGRYFINQSDIRRAFIKTGIGAEKKSRVISEKEKKITAYHEAGHAILFHVLPEMEPVHTISIIPTGIGAAGYTMPLPGKDEMFNSRKKMLENIVVSLGGRIAEELIFDDITTGASQDIKQASQMARAMVTQYGMSDKVGMIHYGSDEDEVFIGRDLAHTRNYAEETAALIDSEVKRIIDESYAKAKEILKEHEDVLHRCANLLIEKEKIGREEFEALF